MLIYSETITSRLQYIAEFIGNEITGKPIEITTDRDIFSRSESEKINYSNQPIQENEFRIAPHPLLFQAGITEQHIDCFTCNDRPAFFRTEGDFPFDLFAASFYLLSRYEEYLPHTRDMYGRYAHENSLAFREKFLEFPLVNNWLTGFIKEITKKFPGFKPRKFTFRFLPTYDIDIAWSYRHKGLLRTAGGYLGSLLNGKWGELIQRSAVLRGRAKDPFDTYNWLHQLHERFQLKPYYFFLLAADRGKYDKNIRPGSVAMRELIKDHVIRYPVGIHPSWQSGDTHGLLRKEINQLASITGHEVLSSRQHYIRLSLPETYRRLLNAGIRFDFSMGYGSINGFRASVASVFYWYDLIAETRTDLMLFPFCFMEANSFYEQKFNSQQALEEMRHYFRVIKSVNGTFIMIWHNQFFGTSPCFAGWKEVYEQFINESAAGVQHY